MQRCCFWILALVLALFALGCGGGGTVHLGASTQWDIGSAGGTYTTSASDVTLTVPAGAVASTQKVTYTALTATPTGPAGATYVAGTGYSFTHAAFTSPATLAIKFPEGTPTGALKMYRQADGSETWVPLVTTVNAASRTASAQIDGFSSYALFYQAPLNLSAHWTEWRKNVETNKMFIDIYTAPAGGTETLTYSPAQEQGTTQLRYATFRWSDKSLLGLDFADPVTYIASFNVETSTTTRIGQLPVDEGKYISSLEMVRANNVAGADYVAVQYSQRNQTTGENRDSLVLFHPGSMDPTVLLTFTRSDNQAATTMRPMDVTADGKVLVLRDNGLNVITASGSTSVLVGAEKAPMDALFSPTGSLVLFRQTLGADGGWKLVNPTTFVIAPVSGDIMGDRVRWANDDAHVVSATSAGDNRRIELIDITTGDVQLLTIGGDHSSSHINDVGVHN